MKREQWMGQGVINGVDMSCRSASDRGRADAYYHRGCNPHKIVNNVRFSGEDLTQEERDEYVYGYEDEPDRKSYD